MKIIASLTLCLILSISAMANELDWSKFDSAFSTKAEYQDTPYRKMIQSLDGSVLSLESIDETPEAYLQKSNAILVEWMNHL